MINWQGYDWLTQERWGNIHLDKPDVWYDPTAVDINSEGHLLLSCRPNPKTFKVDGGEIISPIGTGLVSCTTEFGYGIFEIEAKLPTGAYTWPAFWMWAFESWPPEIDVFEAYSNKRGSYFNWNKNSLMGKFWSVDTNVHYGVQPNNKMIGGKSHYLGWRRPDSVFNKYGLIWTESSIEITFNGRVVRSVTDPEVINQFKGKKLNVIINNSIQSNAAEKLYITLTDMVEHTMIVKSFKFSPL